MSKTVCLPVVDVEVPLHIHGLILNVDNAPQSWTIATHWESKIRDITWSFDDNHPRFRHGQWREVFDKQLSTTPFGIQAADPLFSLPIGEEFVRFSIWLSREAFWERYQTLSQISNLNAEQRAVFNVELLDRIVDADLEQQDIKSKVMEATEKSEDERNDKGELALHGRTVFCWTNAVPSDPLRAGG